jgi:hypothetical protein
MTKDKEELIQALIINECRKQELNNKKNGSKKLAKN